MTLVLGELCRIYIGLVLLFSVFAKAMQPARGRATVAGLVPPIAWAAGSVLLVGGIIESLTLVAVMIKPRSGLGVAGALMTGFTVTLAIAVLRGRSVECACLGGKPHPVGPTDLIRNVVILLICGVAFSAWSATAWSGSEFLVLAGMAAIGLIITVGVSDLGWLFG